MKLPLLAALLACLPVLRAAAQPSAQRISLVIDEADPKEQELFNRLAASYHDRAAVTRYELDESRIGDPIAKGKLLAQLENSDLIVAVGDGATDFAAREVEDVPVYFVDARVVDGRLLASPTVSGIFTYSVDGLLDAAKALRLDAVGVAFTPGYEPIVELIRNGAAARGMTVAAKNISASRDIAPAVRGLLEKTRTIWLIGDPLLVRGAGFDFIRERTLSLNVPVVGPGLWDIQHGSLLGYLADPGEQEAAAERSIDALLKRRPLDVRLSPAPRGGTLLLNGTLADKWSFAPTRGLRWRVIR